MSHGPGKIQKQLTEIFKKNGKRLFSTEQLCSKVFKQKDVMKKHRVSVLRALKRISELDTLNVWRIALKGRRNDLWFNHDHAKPGLKPVRNSAPANNMRPRKK